MNTEEKLEQSSIVKERGTQYFKVSYSPPCVWSALPSPRYRPVLVLEQTLLQGCLMH